MGGHADGRLLVADSCLLRDGRMRGHERHRERFLRACADCEGAKGPPLRRLVEFWQDVTAALPRVGDWFSRAELNSGSQQLRLRLRPAQPLAQDVRVWATGQPDPRTLPRRKGPDLPALARLRKRAVAHGADEAFLVAPTGLVLEAATASLVWWEGDVLCLPPPQLPVLAGVTIGLVQERARQSGVRVAHRERTLAELDGREVWVVNALHGIRPVTAWLGRSMNAGHAVRAPEWRAWLDEMMEPLPQAH
ncbi:aminotransferase class IV [Streptomyces sp. NPDC001406]|uniref:aminotransferase class IV n=1 Tax=Streptomyces sp. NPDC001406 TaxID=3364572 RepID=UPI0036939ED0